MKAPSTVVEAAPRTGNQKESYHYCWIHGYYGHGIFGCPTCRKTDLADFQDPQHFDMVWIRLEEDLAENKETSP